MTTEIYVSCDLSFIVESVIICLVESSARMFVIFALATEREQINLSISKADRKFYSGSIKKSH